MSELANEKHFNYTPTDEDKKNSEAAVKAAMQQIMQISANRKAQEATTGCHKPLFNVGKKKKAYEACLADNKKAATAPAPVTNVYNGPSSSSSSKPFFKTGGGVAVIVVGSIALVVGTVLLIKHFKK